MPSNDAALEGDKNIDIVHSLVAGSPFKIRADDEKLAILKKGRPLFNINVVKRDSSRNCSRTFHSSWYTIHKWLCGSENYNKLFCWPCLLMRPETSSWCSTGNDDMKRFTSLATKHARCKSHLKAISEYDEALTNFGLPPEFISGVKFKCKEEEGEEEQEEEEQHEQEEEGSMSDKTEADDDFQTLYSQNTERQGNPAEANQSDCKDNKGASKINTKITFKAWQELYQNNFAISKSKFFEDSHLYKWKRKIVKQELRNARLVGEKLKFEIEVLKAKIEYYKALKQETGPSGESPVPVVLSEVLQS